MHHNLLLKLVFLSLISITSAYTSAQQLPKQTANSQDVSYGSQSMTYRPPTVPESVSFAGERVPLERFEVYERLDRDLLTNSYFHTSTLYILKLKTRFFPIIERILAEEGVPDDFKYLCVAESSLQNLRSTAGAQGYWQFLKATAQGYGMEVNEHVDERNHLEKSTRAACRYLKEAKNKFGNWTAAAASYNCGMGGYNNFGTSQGSMNYYDLLLPEETNRYIFRIIALKLILENPSKYGFSIAPSQTYSPIPSKKVVVDYSINDLIQWASAQGSSYKLVRLMNPWIIGRALPNKSGKRYEILLPLEG